MLLLFRRIKLIKRNYFFSTLFLFAVCIFSSCMTTYSFTVSNNQIIPDNAKSPYTITKTNDFEIEISGFKTKHISLHHKFEKYRQYLDLQSNGVSLTSSYSVVYDSSEKINSVKIICLYQMLFDNITIENEVGTIIINFTKFEFGKSREELYKEQETLKKIQNAPAMDNFWGIKFASPQKHVITEMDKKDCKSYTIKNISPNNIIISYTKVEDYATTKPKKKLIFIFLMINFIKFVSYMKK